MATSNLVRFEARRAHVDWPAVTIRDLLRATLRHRPDRVVVGEVRGAEAFDLLQALNTGHSGTLSTIHANSAVQALDRFASCVLQSGVELPYAAVRHQIADALDLVCSASTTLAASRQLFWPVPITWIDINNIDACGWCGRRKRRPQRCGKRAASAGHAGTTARARFPRRWHDPQAARIPDGWGVQEVGRRRTRGNSGPGARPRGAGDGGDVRRDLSVR